MKPTKQNWQLYILQCKDGSLYTGITLDIKRRIAEHESGKGAKYTRGRTPITLVYQESCKSKSAAAIRELEIKKLNKAEKLKLIDSAAT